MTIAEMDAQGVDTRRIYFKMALPLTLSLVVSLIYNVADTWFIAATGNTNLIAGVSLGAPVLTLLMAFGNIYGQGGSSLISRLIGRQQAQEVRRVSAVCFYLAILTGAAAGVIMLAFQTPILYLLGSDAQTFGYAQQYYRWLAVGGPFIVLSFVLTNLLRAEGMSKESMAGSIGGVVLNIILDPVFIFAFGMGAAGAAAASVLGYVFTDIFCCFIVIRKSRLLCLYPKEAKTSGENVAQIFGVGIPAAITNIMQSISLVLVNQFLLPYGNDKIAAMGIAYKVAMIVGLVLTGFSFGGLPLFGFYYGADKRGKVMELFAFCMKFICLLAVVLSVMIFAAAPVLIRLFVSDTSLVTAGILMLRLLVITTVFAGIVQLVTLLFQSMGKIVRMFFLSVSRQGIVFIIVLFIASHLAGYYGIIASQAVADVISAAVAVLMFVQWKKAYIV